MAAPLSATIRSAALDMPSLVTRRMPGRRAVVLTTAHAIVPQIDASRANVRASARIERSSLDIASVWRC
jgi:hypothetical protein